MTLDILVKRCEITKYSYVDEDGRPPTSNIMIYVEFLFEQYVQIMWKECFGNAISTHMPTSSSSTASYKCYNQSSMLGHDTLSSPDRYYI